MDEEKKGAFLVLEGQNQIVLKFIFISLGWIKTDDTWPSFILITDRYVHISQLHFILLVDIFKGFVFMDHMLHHNALLQ